MKNRRFVNLPVSKQKVLNLQYRNMFEAIEQLHDTGVCKNVECVSISIFKHWLSFDEAREKLSNVNQKTQLEYNKKLYTFVCLLTTSFDCYLVKYKGRQRNIVTYRKFTSDSAREATLHLKDYRSPERLRFILVIPELDAIYYEDGDFTHHLYFRKGNKVDQLNELLTMAGVYSIS